MQRINCILCIDYTLTRCRNVMTHHQSPHTYTHTHNSPTNKKYLSEVVSQRERKKNNIRFNPTGMETTTTTATTKIVIEKMSRVCVCAVCATFSRLRAFNELNNIRNVQHPYRHIPRKLMHLLNWCVYRLLSAYTRCAMCLNIAAKMLQKTNDAQQLQQGKTRKTIFRIKCNMYRQLKCAWKIDVNDGESMKTRASNRRRYALRISIQIRKDW